MRRPVAWYQDESTDPMASALIIGFYFSVFCWLAAPALGDYSIVDRLWSILPAMYTWHFASKGGYDQRLTIMALWTTIWGARLTYNFFRKGGYKLGHEDYRWPYVRAQIPAWLFQVLNLVFIAFFQNWLLMMLTAPAYVAVLVDDKTLQTADLIAAGLFMVFLAIEVVADEQQWDFQTLKHAQLAGGMPLRGDFRRGFLSKGLFALSRHPNFFAEQMIWWSFYLFSVTCTGQLINWTILGPLILSLLFQTSTPLTESLSLQKYPAYRVYMQTTSRLMPWCPGPSLDELKLE
ncbi:uncharacterized protein MONBRDRAFT_14787 [Monosiga brevicollis MX1]|uniref:Steroid 5-alpha reductase C-terminal domain-containing protein n=1 Tax=Monosiga brevicollis TaxID=81824 RepID=A9UR72_MONBE|nr:uncharacterized protein MONBRDRAFT_14787 [Monosiga brevicollis MX1]EDQ91871.1 predicted protein [Monosiga brevicollis MX1]|eukprot:XP_001743157.1 hypothetical protein [Monosiga brevicollis MX1]